MSNYGGKRKGAGRKKGSKSKKTLEKEIELERVKQRIFSFTDKLVDSQLSLARGISYLYKIEKQRIVGPKGGISYKSLPPKLVTHEFEIQAYLEGLVNEGDMDDKKDREATYYYITTEKPENQAIKDMLDRAFGKPVETVEATVTETLKIDV